MSHNDQLAAFCQKPVGGVTQAQFRSLLLITVVVICQ